MNATAADWTHIEPLLDEAMHALDDTDRTAVLLRYFENKSLREVGANPRHERERRAKAPEPRRRTPARILRQTRRHRRRERTRRRHLRQRRSSRARWIGSSRFQPPPLLAGTTLATTASQLPSPQSHRYDYAAKDLIAAALAVAVGTGIFEARQISRLRSEVRTLQQQHATVVEENGQLLREREQAANRLAALADDMAKTKAVPTELLRLRGEVSRLGAELRESPLARIAALKRKLEQMPDKRIPELQFLTEKDWAMAAWDADLTSNDGVRRALGALRERAIDRFLEEMMTSFKKYLAANGGVLPADLFQLKPYFEKPVTDEMLQRYQLLQTGKPDADADLVRLVAHVDEEYDSHHRMTLNAAMGEPFNRVAEAVKIAAVEFANDNNGQLPTDPGQLSAYLKQPIDAATVQKYLKGVAADAPSPEVRVLAPALRAFTEANGGKLPASPFDVVQYLSHFRTAGGVFTTGSNAPRSCRADAGLESVCRESQRARSQECVRLAPVCRDAGTRSGASKTGAMEDA